MPGPDWYESFLEYPIPVSAQYKKKADKKTNLVCSKVDIKPPKKDLVVSKHYKYKVRSLPLAQV
jgi:hypothetical protein